MEGKPVAQEVARKSAVVYTAISISIAGLFFLLASVLPGPGGGPYPPVARFGGVIWSFMLSMIVTMPLVTSAVKKRAKARVETND